MNLRFTFLVTLTIILFITSKCDPDGPDPWYACDSDKYSDRCFGSDCTNKDINYRLGIECNEFPWYAGGSQIIEREKEKNDCIEGIHIDSNITNINGYGYCNTWKTRENSNDPTNNRTNSGSFETETGRCTCYNATTFFCSYWYCETVELNVDCGYSSSVDSSLECYEKTTTETKDCVCHNVSSTEKQVYVNGSLTNMTYCAGWTCTEYNKRGRVKEIETNKCRSLIPTDSFLEDAGIDVREETDKIESLSNQFCWVWETDINSWEEIELIKCKCIDINEEETYCTSWQCREKDYAKHFRSKDHLLWPILGPVLMLIFGGVFYFIFGYFLSQCVTDDRPAPFKWCFVGFVVLVFVGFFLWLCAALGGVAFIIIWGCIIVPIGCIIFFSMGSSIKSW